MEEKNSEKKERKMRDSGIPWIGEVPEGWELVPLKYLLSNEVNSLKVGPFGSQLSGSDFTDDGYWVYNQRSVLDKNFDSNDTFISESKFNSMNSFKVEENDILITTRGTIGKICRIPQNYHKGIIHPCIIKFRINESLLMYSLLEKIFNESDLVKKQFEINSNATTIDVIYGSTLRNILIPVPPVSEQHRIADFLDSKYSEIDTLIENLRARMQSAKEYKKAVITEAVTKGLNKDAKMKDSGVEWIGEIPEGWKYAKAKYCIEIQNGSDPHLEGNIPVYGSGAKSFKTCGEYKNGPTVLIGRKGATLHIPHYIVGKFWNVDTAFNVYTKPHYLLKYYYYCAVSFDYKSYISQTTLPSMTQTNYENMVLPMPSLLEQQQIVSFLDSKCSEIDALLQNYEDQIATLEEYKKSLIYEYVTGKKEVPTA